MRALLRLSGLVALCADQNAWAFFEAIWSEKDPLNPSRALPSAPGLVWMLRGMNISGGQVRYGSADDGQQWIMAGGTTVAHMHVHFSEATYEALTEIPPPEFDR